MKYLHSFVYIQSSLARYKSSTASSRIVKFPAVLLFSLRIDIISIEVLH